LTSHERTDEALFESARNGNDDAFRVLVERHAGGLRTYIDRRLPRALRRKISVADVAQEAHVVALRRALDFEDRGDGSFRKWLNKIAELKVKEAIRKHAGTAKRAAGREISRGKRPDTGQFVGDATTPSQAAIGAEAAEQVRQALETLPEDYREVLRLTREECLTLREAAARMGRSREAAKKLYGRALLRFKKALDEIRGVA